MAEKNETHESDKTIDQVAPAWLRHQDHRVYNLPSTENNVSDSPLFF
ncbi:hypothetical protein M1D52_07345 [Olivibacter sp. SA151]